MRVLRWCVFAVAVVVIVILVYREHQVSRGREAFRRLGCATCHLSGGAPSLEHVARKYDRDTIIQFVSNPDSVYSKRNYEPLNAGYSMMPRLYAPHEDIVAISYYLRSLD